MNCRCLLKILVLPTILLAGCNDAASTCGDPEIVELASELARDEIETRLSLASLLGGQRVVVDVSMSQFREYQNYDDRIHKRYCEASTKTKILGGGAFLQAGALVNGIDPRDLERGLDGMVRYSVHVTSDGTHLVGLEE